MNVRVYDPNVGRFLSVDPVFQAPTNGQSVNPYSYVLNNPLSLTDPSGYTAVIDNNGGSGPNTQPVQALTAGDSGSVTFKDPTTGQTVTITAVVNADGSVSVYDNKGTAGMNMAVVSAIQSLGNQSTTTPSSNDSSGSAGQGAPAQRGTVTINTQGAPDGFAADVIKSMAHTDASGIDPYNDIINKGVNLTINYAKTKTTAGEAGDDGFDVTFDHGSLKSANLYWNPNQGIRVNGPHGDIQSAAMGLFHEAEHVVRTIDNGLSGLETVSDKNGIVKMRATETEEDWIIQHPESQAAKVIGEPTRDYHWQGGLPGEQVNVSDPTCHSPDTCR